MEWAYVISGIVGAGILTCFGGLIYHDIKRQKLPNYLIIILATLSLVFLILTEVIIEQKSYSILIIDHLLALIPITILYLIVHLASKGKLVGLGDVKLGIPIAILLPWQGALAVLVLANIAALIVIIPLLATKKIKPQAKIPLGPFLIAATVFTFFVMKFFVNFF
jgi:leader peptidase (prepilin peptidase)/N-methyltransferase